MPRPKPPEKLLGRQVRMSDRHWLILNQLGGAQWLRELLDKKAPMPKKQSGGVIPASPVMTSPIQGRTGRRPIAGGNMAKGGQTFPDLNKDGKVTQADVLKGRGVYKKGGQAHPGFKAVQAKIAAKSGVSKAAAGAILASSTRKASAKAKAANPRLKRVK